MIRFDCDYTEGCHERILARLAETNLEQTAGYGEDDYCRAAAEYIRNACEAPDADVHFMVGGTQTNTVMIAAALRPHQGVVSATSGHIATHESGAIEATGHKVLTLPSDDGKITADQIRALYAAHWSDEAHEHCVQPGLVYITHPTENGAVYSRAELEDLSAACRACGLPLMLDGARLGYALASPGNDLMLPDLARLCDMFYIGGTKLGALFGEAVVISNPAFKKDFRYIIKQRGGLLSKGRLLGLQFEALFKDGLYMKGARHAVEQALRVKQALAAKGIKFRYESATNMQFPVLSAALHEKLTERFVFSAWGELEDGSKVVRVCTSWATRKEDVDALLECAAEA